MSHWILSLNLNHNNLKNEGVACIIDSVINATQNDLKILNLNLNGIEKEGLLKISHHLNINQSKVLILKLEILTLSGNDLSEIGV